MIVIPVREPDPHPPTRWSSRGDEHFLTLCTAGLAPGLTTPQLSSEFHAATHLLTLERQWHVRTATVMPHHAHLLVTVGEHTAMPAVVAMFKDRLAPCLQRAGLHWHGGYCDRRIQPGEDRLPAFLYIFRNPYRVRLIAPAEIWPGYYCADGDWTWFASLTRATCRFPEWLLQWRLYAVNHWHTRPTAPGRQPLPRPGDPVGAVPVCDL